ncbi:hypothetical protein D3C84_487190 [compost metagenome]
MLGNLRMGQAFDLAQQETLAAQPRQLRQGTLEHFQALAMIEHALWRRGEIALLIVEHVQGFGLTQGIASMVVDDQVEGGAIKECPGLLDRRITGALQDPQISVMHHIFGHLTVAQPGVQETHQLAIVVFQHDSRPHGGAVAVLEPFRRPLEHAVAR